MRNPNNRIVVDLNKCQFARFFYRNQFGQTKDTLPEKPTTRGCSFDPDEHIYGSEVTLITFAQQHGLLDKWVPEVLFQLSSNHSLAYTGKKAVSLYGEWCRRIFKKK